MSPLPQWLQNLDIMLSLAQSFGWIIGLPGLILGSGLLLGRAAMKRSPALGSRELDPYRSNPESKEEVKLQGPVTMLGTIHNLLFQGRDLLFQWIMRPDISVEWELLSVAFQATGLLCMILVYLNLDPPTGPILLVRTAELQQAVILFGVAAFAVLLVFGTARLRWRIGYVNRWRDDDRG